MTPQWIAPDQSETPAIDLVPVFVVVAQTTLDRNPEESSFVQPGFRDEFEPLYIVVSFDNVQPPLADS